MEIFLFLISIYFLVTNPTLSGCKFFKKNQYFRSILELLIDKTFPYLKKLLLKLAILSLLIEQVFFTFVTASNALANASDLPITPDGSTSTQIDQSANGVKIVNIAPTNSNSVSHNKFTDYNVNHNGLILNNATGSQNGLILTQIGGLINDNLNLKNSGSASIILNEVTSSNISQINGFTEVAGNSADLILANPNGFVFNGAGFINVNKLTAVVGSNNTQNSNALNFQLSDQQFVVKNGFLPKITITGKGLDLEKISSSDLVANVMNIIAPIYAGNNDVNLRSGDESFDYLSKAVASNKIESSSPPCDNQATQCPDPQVNKSDSIAIDASTLGKIQAGKIFIIATKEGFGIKYNADLLAQRAGIVIDSQGNIDYQNVSATGNANQANISITSHRGSITQNGIIQTKDLANNITLNAFKEIKNYGKFFSSADVDIESKTQDFINYSQSNLAKNNFTIKAINFSNLGEITAENDLKINTLQVSNSNKLVANANLIINADQINNRNSLYSQNNIALNANEINNNTQDSQIYALNDIALKTNSINNTDGKIQAKNNLKLQDLALNDLSPDWQFKINDQLISINNANGNFYAKNLLEFDLQNANYSIAGDLKSDGKIKITARNITNQINLQANNDLEIIALDTFTNGVLNGDNSNTKIIANNKLFITATNLLSNYATLSAKNNLQLTSLENNINNHIKAEIIAGTKTKIDSQDGKEKYLYQGLLTLNAKNGIVNQNSLNSIIVNGNYNLDVTDFINTGKVEVAGDLFFNIANDLINDVKALILAGGNLEINVGNDLTNKTDAVIYSQGNLTIQKYPSNNPLYNPEDNKINKLTNSSGQIISYNGDMTINAKTIENKRTIDPFNAVLDPQNKGTISNPESEKLNQYNWHYKQSGCFGHKCENTYSGYYALQLTNTGSIPSLIQSNKNLFFNADKLNNIASNILAQGDITVNAYEFKNFSINDAGLYYITTSWNDNPVYSLASTQFVNFDGGNGHHPVSDLNPANYLQINTANFKSAKKIFLNSTKEIGNEKTQEDSQVSKINQREANLINSLNVSEIINNGIINLDLSNYFSAQSVIGLFVKSSNPNSPLFETRSQFIDQSKFFGSNYFYQKIGLNLTDLQTQFEQQNKKLIGDQFFQNKIISDQLATITKNSFLLSAKETNANNEIKSLLDNASDEYKRLNLTANKSLNSDQINSLQKDIVWYEAQNINGSSYIVPKIYLSKTSRDNLKNQALATKSTIYAGGDLEINSSSGSLNNSGSIIANNIKITTKDDIINNNFSEMIASNDLALNSLSGSITNRSKLEANNDLTLVAKKNITNTSTVITNDSNLLNSGNVGYVANGLSQDNQRHIASNILETATILAGNITINAGEDFNNNSANIATAKNTLVDNSTTSGNITITAGDDINISTLELKNRTETSWGSKSKGGKSVVETTTNVASNIDIGGSLNVKTTGLTSDSTTNGGSNINIKGSNIATDGNLILVAKDEVNITSAVDSSYKMETSYKKGLTYSVSSNSINSNTKNISSNLTSGGDVAISSGKDTNIITSNITGEGNGSINAGSYIDYDIASTTYGQTITNSDARVNILSAKDTSYSYSERIKVKTELNATNTLVTVASIGGAFFTSGATLVILGAVGSYSLTGAVDHDKSSLTKGSTSETIVKSNLSFANKLTIASASDLTVKASNLTTEQGNISLTSGNDINILSDTETNSFYQYGSINGLFGSNKQQKADTNSTNNITSVITAGSDKTSVNGNLELTSVDNTTLQAAKLNTNKDITLIVGENLMILPATNSLSTSYINNDETTFNFTNGSSGNFNTQVINTEILTGVNSSSGGSAGNLVVNVGGNILAQYNAKNGETALTPTIGIIDSTLTRDFSATPELAYINALNPAKTQYQSLDEISQSWGQTKKGLNENGQLVIAAGAVSIAIGTGGIGSGLSGAIMTAVATAAGSTATISATNASMNADGNLAGSLDDVTKTTFKDTTSKEAIKNYAIAAVVAGAAYGVGQWMKSEGINPSFESGTMENSKVGVNAKYNSNGVLIKEGSITIQNPNGIETNYWASNQNPAFKTLNTTPGAPSFADFHDAMNFPAGVNQVTIAPYYAMSQCAASPTLCAMFPDTFIKVGTWGQVDTNLDTNKNDYEKNN